MTDPSPWHALEGVDVAARFDVDVATGLAREEAARRLAEHGRNELADDPPPSRWIVLLRQFRSPLIYILLGAAVVTVALGELLDAAVIAAVLVVNAGIGFAQERRAEGAVRALMGLVVPQATVVRDGGEQGIDSRELVPGDVVVLESGDRVPADLRLVRATVLRIDESLLTGESRPVSKGVAAVSASAPIADRTSMAYTGSVVSSGRGRGVVVATGAATELGTIADLVRGGETARTPLQERMDRFAGVVGVGVGIAALVAFASGIALGRSVDEMFLTAVALAVAAIPEGLPVVFTVTLALGVRRMARRNAIIRRLPAVETLGSATVIGSDKTGTLTQNRMTVRTIVVVDGDRYHPFRVDGETGLRQACPASTGPDARDHPALRLVLRGGVLANEAELHVGDPTEIALLRAAIAAGLEPDAERARHEIVHEVPFESERRWSGVVTRTASDPDAGAGGQQRGESLVRPGRVTETFVKGAPERIIEMCTHSLGADGRRHALDHDEARRTAHRLAAEGLRVLAVAHRASGGPGDASGEVDDQGSADVPGELDDPRGLVLVGFHGMLDPPRPGVRDAVATCHRAGIRVVMITGDHADTARSIAADLGIAPDDSEVLTGADVAACDDDELRRRIADVAVYARVSPADKLRVVEAFQAEGEIVAVTGDGVNDAPALRAAAIGIAMGRDGTDVAREAADAVLTDDDFVSIAAAVEEGRVTFDNLRKVTFFLVSTGVATIVAILSGVWAQWPLVMLPAQLLWLNLVTNGVQDVALAFEPGEEDVLDRPPRRPTEGVLSTRLWRRAVTAGIVMAAGTLVMFRWELDRSGSETSAQSVALTTMVVFMAFHAGNARSESRSVLRVDPRSNPFLLVATVAALGVHVAALSLPPTQYVLRVEPLDAAAWLRAVLVAASVLVVMEVVKATGRRVDGRGPQRVAN